MKASRKARLRDDRGQAMLLAWFTVGLLATVVFSNLIDGQPIPDKSFFTLDRFNIPTIGVPNDCINAFDPTCVLDFLLVGAKVALAGILLLANMFITLANIAIFFFKFITVDGKDFHVLPADAPGYLHSLSAAFISIFYAVTIYNMMRGSAE